ncbi:MAG TPA: PQQ-binding-like beta-propeller repeat protein [Bryobacteraceae bacterium]|nr:PQQ-binding-like beta-propeller repeat protein [Bryobacteraceae bacterium]
MRRRTFLPLLAAPVVMGQAQQEHWPHWRGPRKTGVATTAAPVKWSATENVAWKVDIPGRGFSTPVTWGEKLFLTTAIPQGAPPPPPAESGSGRPGRGAGGGAGPLVDHKFQVMCLDRRTGKTIWEQTAKTATPHEGYHQAYGSFASNSPITDGNRLYASFGSRGIYCYDLNGKLIWQKENPALRMRLGFGEGAAPALDSGVLLIKNDQEQGSFVVALDATTGEQLWKADREEVSSWSGPLVITHGGVRQAIVSASRRTISYDLKTGKVLWEVGGLGSNVIPQPLVIDDIVLVMSGHREPNLMAIRLGKTGDLTGTDAILWQNQRGNSYTAAPVLHEGLYYFITDTGMVSCFDAKTGKPHYTQQRLPKAVSFKASPLLAGDKLYLASEEEDVFVLKAGPSFEVVQTNTMAGQSFIASPIVVGGALYLRSRTTLFCVRA